MDFLRFFRFIFYACLAFQVAQSAKFGHLRNPLENLHKNEPKIINGTEAQWEGTRYQVSVRLAASDWFFGAGHICGGTLISSRAVLTAGHCIWSANRFRNASDYSVVLGNLNRYQRDNNSLVFGVTKISVHPNFNATTYEADVAVLHLDAAVPLNFTKAYPIPLNDERNLSAGTVCQVSGWGRTENGGYSPELRVVDVAVVNRSQCATNYGGFIRDVMICAGYMEGGRDACVGDSGGPLVCVGKLVGVVSFGVGCAEPGYPGVYADVASYVKWIQNETNSFQELGGFTEDGAGFSDNGDDNPSPIGYGGVVGNNAAIARSTFMLAFSFWLFLKNLIYERENFGIFGFRAFDKIENMYKNLIFLVIFCGFVHILLTSATPRGREVSFERDGRIINGTLAEFNDTKHQVSIRSRRNDGYFFGTGHLCGGSLIRANVVLSAAHCFVDYNINNGSFRPATDFIVVMGNLDRFERNNYTLVFDIAEVVYNVSYFNLSTYESDIALVFLNDSVPETYTRAQAINITTEPVAAGTVCQVTGWGQTENGTLSDYLLTVDVPIIDFDVCASNTSFSQGLIREGMLCAGYSEGERDACSGDSGGPLVCNEQLAGIVSWGIGCALPSLPGVYTNVSYWAKWIDSQLNSAASFTHTSGLMTFVALFCALILNR
ncbi:CUB and peptidase domain-containing protein 2-like [Anastrepha obliqua]|uniref:CUB and peptidase domain-containing protein 2-like n=1 Tax=Anastrepha obliqua TaxID=95512 RepID=UPI002409DEBA|nr:CUB and peptidase domain-containing protein 2-like [Anastrepha obliqua]